MRCLAQGATGGWVMLGLVFQWFPLCEFSLFDTPWGQFSGSLGSWSQCSDCKGSGLDLEFCVVLYILLILFCSSEVISIILSLFFSTGQVLLSTVSWCSACASVSETVFLMYPWREMYSASTYSFAILFSCVFPFVLSSFTGS